MKNISIIRFVLIVLMLFVTNVFAVNNEDYNKAKNYLKCQNCDLSNADFSDLDLRGLDLEQSNLVEANFSGADLSIAKKEKYNLPSNLTPLLKILTSPVILFSFLLAISCSL